MRENIFCFSVGGFARYFLQSFSSEKDLLFSNKMFFLVVMFLYSCKQFWLIFRKIFIFHCSVFWFIIILFFGNHSLWSKSLHRKSLRWLKIIAIITLLKVLKTVNNPLGLICVQFDVMWPNTSIISTKGLNTIFNEVSFDVLTPYLFFIIY